MQMYNASTCHRRAPPETPHNAVATMSAYTPMVLYMKQFVDLELANTQSVLCKKCHRCMYKSAIAMVLVRKWVIPNDSSMMES